MSTEYDFDAWPNVLLELVQLIGPEATLKLAYAYGGLEQVYIPQEPTAEHPWTSVLTPEQWAKVVTAWGGQRVTLPRGTYIKVLKRQILDLAEQGIPHRQIALMVHTTQRHVRRVLQGQPRRAHEDPRQRKLFE